MKLLFTIPHYFNPQGSGKHASLRPDPQPRIRALTASIAALHQLFGKSQYMIDIAQRLALPVNQPQTHQVDIRICTTRDCHLLAQLPVPRELYVHHPTDAEPMLLGFDCQAVLRDYLGEYDYYGYLEDDLILHDPLLFSKLSWFTRQTGVSNLLQPNRYELSIRGAAHKVYVDGDVAPHVTAPFQNMEEQPELKAEVLGTSVSFRRTLNPHSGCYFLNAEQMAYWSKQSYYLDRDTSFIGPLESAATLGIMRAFRVYKPATPNASFLEIQHYGTGFLRLIGREVRMPG